MFIKTHTKNVTTYNVLGFIEGAIEPGMYVNISLNLSNYLSQVNKLLAKILFDVIILIDLVRTLNVLVMVMV